MAGAAAGARFKPQLQISVAFVVSGVCVLRYDNEVGKGDHRHVGTVQSFYAFTTPEQLYADFMADVRNWSITRNTTYFGEPITQYAPNTGMVVNGTSKKHFFDDGYVVRWRAIDSLGNVSIWTYGRGNNNGVGTQLLNGLAGPAAFLYRGAQNRRAVLNGLSQ